jgi:hypothetical protein
MPTLPIAFLNCHNLRAGKNAAVSPQKILDLASMLNGLGFATPAFICLCEVADVMLGQRVATAAFPNTSYGSVWSHRRKLPANEPGMIILYDKRTIDDPVKEVRDQHLRTAREPSRWLAAKFTVKALPQDPLWVITNHWHSGFHDSYDGEYNRRRVSNEISNLFRGTRTLKRRPTSPILDQRSDKIVAIGDFNCEPSDRVFRLSEQGAWKVSPDVNAVLAGSAWWPCFFNPMVKAPGIFGTFQSEAHGLSLPMLDHILVSGNLCQPAGLRYSPNSIVASPFLSRASDHAAIGAILEY